MHKKKKEVRNFEYLHTANSDIKLGINSLRRLIILFTATCFPRQRPLYTSPNDPFPNRLPKLISSGSIDHIGFCTTETCSELCIG